jgi:hypothetical protein
MSKFSEMKQAAKEAVEAGRQALADNGEEKEKRTFTSPIALTPEARAQITSMVTTTKNKTDALRDAVAGAIATNDE